MLFLKKREGSERPFELLLNASVTAAKSAASGNCCEPKVLPREIAGLGRWCRRAPLGSVMLRRGWRGILIAD